MTSPSPERPSHRIAWAVATTFGLGDLLPAPGTLAGSLPAAAAWWLVAVLVPVGGSRTLVSLAITLLLAAVAVWAAGVEARRRGLADPGAVVIDEVAGQWLCLLLAGALLAGVDHPPSAALTAAGGFALFRVLDVVKPWPIRSLERLRGGLGIVADDLAAGAVAGLAVGLAWRLLA